MFAPRWLRAVCLLPLLLSPAFSLTAQAASPRASTISAAAPSQAAPGSPRREVFGYALSSSLGSSTVGYPSWNFDDLSTVAFFAIHVNPNGTLANDANMTVWNSSSLTSLVTTAHAHNVKVVVTIVAPGGAANMCSALYNDQTTVTAIVSEVQAKGIDGVNIDYEGSLGTCNTNPPTTPTSNQTLMTRLAQDMRAGLDAVDPSYYLSIATYSGSAAGTGGFFNIPALNQYVDSFFVMAYDMDYSNQHYAPLNCSRFCLAPVSPLAGYYWNDTTSMNQYVSVVGAAKTILGQPYYGRVACINTSGAHAIASSNLTAATYLQAAEVAASPDVKAGTFRTHRDPNDPSGLDRWDTWYDLSLNCWREMHWSDTTTLGARYKLVNDMNLRGVGFWALNYGGGAPELWSAISTYFKSCYALSVSANPGSPQLSSTPVTVTGNATCPDPDPLYRFWMQAPGSTAYQTVQDYSTSPTYNWDTTGLRPGTYHFSIWTRDANSLGRFGNTAGRWDTYNNSFAFTLTSQPCTSVGASVTPPSPAGVGATVSVSATATGCPNPLYQFWMLTPGAPSYKVVQAYSNNAVFDWSTIGAVPGTNQLFVWARDQTSWGTYGNSSGRWDTYKSGIPYTVKSCSSVSVTVSPPGPAASGSQVTISANAAGCPNPNPLYRFYIIAPGSTTFQPAQDYSTAASFQWNTTGLAAGTYRIAVWVKDADSGGAAGNTAGRWDAYNNGTTYTLS